MINNYTGNIGCKCDCHKMAFTHKRLEPLVGHEVKQMSVDDQLDKLITKVNEILAHFTQ